MHYDHWYLEGLFGELMKIRYRFVQGENGEYIVEEKEEGDLTLNNLNIAVLSRMWQQQDGDKFQLSFPLFAVNGDIQETDFFERMNIQTVFPGSNSHLCLITAASIYLRTIHEMRRGLPQVSRVISQEVQDMLERGVRFKDIKLICMACDQLMKTGEKITCTLRECFGS